ncbi:MAG: hypothetical protein D6732_28875 [Methanobacteriota archaeon]|nr:MAG: hypothetical protein D6732_28875 [Euryarchaeota archaeon]
MTDDFVEMLIVRLEKDPELRARFREVLFKEDENEPEVDLDQLSQGVRKSWEDTAEATELRYRFMVR